MAKTFAVGYRARESATVRRTRRDRSRVGGTPTAWLFVAPAVVIILGLSIGPMIWSLLLSFQSADLVTPARWLGWHNYEVLATDPTFRRAVEHTLLYTALFVPLSIVGGLGLALALNRRIRLIGLYRTLIFVPFVVSAASQGVLFSFVFDAQFGIANSLLARIGLPTQGFFADPNEALPLLVAIGLWSGVGFCVIILLAALQDIPPELREAAIVDGAGRGAVLRHVVLPTLRPVLVFLLVWQTIQALQVFDLVYVTTKGGPLGSTVVIVYFVWDQAFQLFQAGYGAAAAYLLAAVLLAASLLLRLYQRIRKA
jgi:multiple sugar transport system permease protein